MSKISILILCWWRGRAVSCEACCQWALLNVHIITLLFALHILSVIASLIKNTESGSHSTTVTLKRVGRSTTYMSGDEPQLKTEAKAGH